MNFDQYFYQVCKIISLKSPCFSRKIGAILVRDKSIVSTGYNGPPRGTPHCGHERLMTDKVISEKLYNIMKVTTRENIRTTCPRQLIPGYISGEHLELCPAQHAEINCISNAARIGASTINTTLYMNCVLPCKSCFGALINAGITEIVVEETKLYDEYSKFIIDNSNIKIRKFEL